MERTPITSFSARVVPAPPEKTDTRSPRSSRQALLLLVFHPLRPESNRTVSEAGGRKSIAEYLEKLQVFGKTEDRMILSRSIRIRLPQRKSPLIDGIGLVEPGRNRRVPLLKKTESTPEYQRQRGGREACFHRKIPFSSIEIGFLQVRPVEEIDGFDSNRRVLSLIRPV